MKATTVRKPKARKPDTMTKLITAALRSARSDAVKTARMHGTAIVYQRDGKIVTEKP